MKTNTHHDFRMTTLTLARRTMMLISLTSEASVAILSLCVIGIFVNIIFMWISMRTKERRDITDINTTSACLSITLNGVQMLLRSIFTLHGEEPNSNVFKFLDTMDFFLIGIYLWSQFLLNIFRLQFVKRLQSPDEFCCGVQKKRCLKAAIGVVVTSSFFYGIYIGLQNIEDMKYAPAILQVFQVIIKEMPFTVTVGLHMGIMVILCRAVYRNKIIVLPENVMTTSSHERIGYIVLTKCLLVYICQTACLILPRLLVYGIEFMIFHVDATIMVTEEISKTYWVTSALLVVMNPLTFGLLLHPRIQHIFKFMGSTRRESNRTTQCNKIEQLDINRLEALKISFGENSQANMKSIASSSLVSEGASSFLPSFVHDSDEDNRGNGIKQLGNKEISSSKSNVGSLSIPSFGSNLSVFGDIPTLQFLAYGRGMCKAPNQSTRLPSVQDSPGHNGQISQIIFRKY